MKSEAEIRAEIATLEHILCAPAYSKEYLRIQIHAAGKMAALEWVLSGPAPIHTDQPTNPDEREAR